MGNPFGEELMSHDDTVGVVILWSRDDFCLGGLCDGFKRFSIASTDHKIFTVADCADESGVGK